jgi:hypothetical protein
MAFDSLRAWLASQLAVDHIATVGSDGFRSNSQVPAQSTHSLPHYGLLFAFNRFKTAVVLCVSDDEVETGSTLYRILGELVFSDHVILIGPSTMRVFPGGRGLLTRKRLGEFIALAGVIAAGLGVTIVAYAAMEAQDIYLRARSRQ